MEANSSSCKMSARKRPRSQQEEGQQHHDHAEACTKSKPVAPTFQKFVAPGGPSLYRPRPEWLGIPTPTPTTGPTSNSTNTEDQAESERTTSTFGRDRDTALILAIRENSTEAALSLIDASMTQTETETLQIACAQQHYRLTVSLNSQSMTIGLVEKANANGITPLMLAAQKGNSTVLRALLGVGADPAVTSLNGTSALLQAAHFGHTDCCSILLQRNGRALTEVANSNSTTPLMRAAQEGHLKSVELLLKYASRHHVNRQNASHMTALMLAAQRGHAQVCQLLLSNTQAMVDLKTDQDSTALLLACKRGHVDVVRVLVTAGCELFVRDSRGHSARSIVQWRSNADSETKQRLLHLLDPSVQVDHMQRAAAAQRNFDMIRMWKLLQANRANVILDELTQHTASIHLIPLLMRKRITINNTNSSIYALVCCMTLPAPLVAAVIQFLPRPKLWNQRINMLTSSRCFADPNAAASCALDLVDEILEESGFLDACDLAIPPIQPPANFQSWCDWMRNRGGCVQAPAAAAAAANSSTGATGPRERPNACTDQVPSPVDPNNPTVLELRHQAKYLQLLAQHHDTLGRVLQSPPFRLPPELLNKLSTVSDLASCLRRLREGLTIDATRALDIVLLASQLCSWYWRERQ